MGCPIQDIEVILNDEKNLLTYQQVCYPGKKKITLPSHKLRPMG
jgi:hypothetical protein